MTPLLVVQLVGFPPLPNVTRRMHWGERAEEARQWRWSAYLVATQALREAGHPEDFPLRSAVVELVVIRPDAHWPDDDNAIAAIKACLDGMTSAGIWIDDRVVHFGPDPVRHEDGPKGLRIEVLMGRAG